MELKNGHRMTDLGTLPQDWVIKRLGDIGVFAKGQGVRKDDAQTGDIPCVRYGELYTRHHDYIKRFYSFISRDIAKTARRIKKGDILFAGSGETKEEIGKCAAFLGDQETYAGGDIVTFSPRNSDPLFLGFLLNTKPIVKQKASRGQGDAVVHISARELFEIRVPLPPLREQIAIATALSDADALITSLEKLIEKKRLIKQGVMQELLRPKEGWEEKTLLDIAEHRKESFDDGDWIESEYIVEQGVRLVQTGNIGIGRFLEKDSRKYISEQSFRKLRCKKLEIGDILICRLAEPAGRACIFPDIGESKVITSVDVTIFRPGSNVCSRIFLVNLFSTRNWFMDVNERVGGTTHKRISRSSLGGITIRVPNIKEQTRIANIFQAMDAEIGCLEKKLHKYISIKQGMMQELLTGKIRLIQ